MRHLQYRKNAAEGQINRKARKVQQRRIQRSKTIPRVPRGFFAYFAIFAVNSKELLTSSPQTCTPLRARYECAGDARDHVLFSPVNDEYTRPRCGVSQRRCRARLRPVGLYA